MSVAPRPPLTHPGGVGGVVSDPAMQRLPVLTWLPVGALASLVVATIVLPAATARMAVPIALAGGLIGVPHGAVDHLAPRWWGAGLAHVVPRWVRWAVEEPGAAAHPLRARSLAMLRFLTLYLALAILALIAFLVAPTATLVVFLLMSAAHFGRGELVTSAERAGRPANTGGGDRVVVAAYGSAIIGLLLWARTDAIEPSLRVLSPWLADRLVDTRTAGLSVAAILVVLGLLALLRDRRRLEAVELGLIVTAFSLAPPLAAFGIYFGLWHAVRHTGRLLDLARRAIVPARSETAGFGSAAATVARASLLPTAVVVAAGLALWTGRDLIALQAEVMVLLSVSLPHLAVVWVLDRAEAGKAGARRRCGPRGGSQAMWHRAGRGRC
ncbi:Brp/Blh family beta-carotene 15,15'-dioxygenase [Lapillicoccus sp.]|uniref:Brp/Blh family beta-carotene 15,15'-dioxygenase n=1 Tax=Lapillicoccus sp. TaxID=1909287 RepID=UPI003262FA2F